MKKILLSILISVIWLVWFWYCDDLFWFKCNNWQVAFQYNWDYYWCMDPMYFSAWRPEIKVSCWKSVRYYDQYLNTNWTWVNPRTQNCTAWWTNTVTYGDRDIMWYRILDYNNAWNFWVIYITWVTLQSNCPTCPSQYTSEECQQEYSLMPISSCDSEYCQLNELCWTWSSWSWDLQWSSLFINWIQHVWWSIIDVTIPAEIQRNYLYTWENEETFKLNVEGLNGDPDYIQWIIDVNSYRPTSEDFTNTFIWGLTLIFPYIIITAFIVFIWRFIRKIFK